MDDKTIIHNDILFRYKQSNGGLDVYIEDRDGLAIGEELIVVDEGTENVRLHMIYSNECPAIF